MEFSIMDLLQDKQYDWLKVNPRVADLPLMTSLYQAPLIVFAYLYFVLICGPKYMKNRPPYSLRTFIKLYDITQILGNIWLIFRIIDSGLFSFTLFCYSYNYAETNSSTKVVGCLWYFLMLKILDFIETGIFVLRKKNDQVSTLHLYHHVTTFFIMWICIRHFPFHPFLITCILNCFIHSIMYVYYFLAACGPNVQKIIAPTKRWITIAQMIQLALLTLYTSQSFFPGCSNGLYWIPSLIIGNLFINLFNFYNFYQETYKKLKKRQ